MGLITFVYPRYLFFLFLIPLFFFIHLVTLKSSKQTALKFANFEAIARVRGVDFFSRNIVILFLSILVIFLLVMGISGLTFHTTINASSFSFVIALDSSQSMEANDISPNRMQAAKEAAIDFVNTVPAFSRIAVISFSGNSLIEQDLTDSKGLIKDAIKEIEISEISGTDIGEAVITGTNLLKGEESRAIILLSDGQINVGNIEEIINYANDNDIIIDTIAIGTEQGGETSFGVSKLDEDSLKSLAYNTGGAFFRALDKEELSSSFNSAIQITRKKVGINLSNYLLIAAILVFTFEYFLVSSRYRRLV